MIKTKLEGEAGRVKIPGGGAADVSPRRVVSSETSIQYLYHIMLMVKALLTNLCFSSLPVKFLKETVEKKIMAATLQNISILRCTGIRLRNFGMFVLYVPCITVLPPSKT